jgi:transcriptional regulator
VPKIIFIPSNASNQLHTISTSDSNVVALRGDLLVPVAVGQASIEIETDEGKKRAALAAFKDGRLFLSGHMMKNTDHHKAFLHNENVLVVFTGHHTYVSGTWYSNPQQASTWNYMSVHAKGTIRFGDADELVAVLKRLTLHYENNNASSTTVFDNLTSEYREPLMKAIVPFEIEVTSIDNVFKLSQDRNEKSYNNIIEKLEQQGGDGKFIAEEMKKRSSQLFSK